MGREGPERNNQGLDKNIPAQPGKESIHIPLQKKKQKI